MLRLRVRKGRLRMARGRLQITNGPQTGRLRMARGSQTGRLRMARGSQTGRLRMARGRLRMARQVCGLSRAERVEVPQLHSVNSAVVIQLGNRGKCPRCELIRKPWRLHARNSWIRSFTWSVFFFLQRQVPMPQTVQKHVEGPPWPSNDKVVDILVVTQKQIPEVQTSRRR